VDRVHRATELAYSRASDGRAIGFSLELQRESNIGVNTLVK
jgi:hypothetical protein